MTFELSIFAGLNLATAANLNCVSITIMNEFCDACTNDHD